MGKHKDTQNTQHYLGNQWQNSHNNHNTISVLIQLHLSLAGDKPQAYKWPFHHYNPYPYNQELGSWCSISFILATINDSGVIL